MIKKIFAILIMLSLSIPVLAIDENEQYSGDRNTLEEIRQEEAVDLNEDVSVSDNMIPETITSPYKTPLNKKKLAKKFIIAMLCVAGCSVFLYGSLTVYNKIRDGFISSQTPPEGEKPLEAPCDLTEAIKTFIEKTKWQG